MSSISSLRPTKPIERAAWTASKRLSDAGAPLDRPDRDGFGYPLDLAAAEVAKREEITEQPARRRGNDDRSRLRQALEPGSEVWCIADGCALL
ncbi:hypothetical protein ABH976_001186 [Bradyrhizobium ottawaense]